MSVVDRARSRHGRADSQKAMRDLDNVAKTGWTFVEYFEHDGRRYVLAVDGAPAHPGIELLSEREREVLMRASAGQDNKTIAYDLGLADSTVRVLMNRAARKLGVGSRRALIDTVRTSQLNIGALRRKANA